MSIGLTDEQVYEVMKRFGEHFNLTELEMEIGDISVKGENLKANPQNISIKHHGKFITHIRSCNILIRGGERPRIILEII